MGKVDLKNWYYRKYNKEDLFSKKATINLKSTNPAFTGSVNLIFRN